MSIFDVLKYPISMPPTKAELEALPGALFDKWIISQSRNSLYDEWIIFHSSNGRYKLDPEVLAIHYKLLYDIENRRPELIKEINSLRMVIKDYEHI